jgi:branched-chain amino acid transport system permease protein
MKRSENLFERAKSVWWVFTLAILLVALPFLTSEFWVIFCTHILIMILGATSLNLLLGYGGMISFGHAAYFGVGAYACALLLTKAAFPLPICIILGPVLAALVALIAGYFVVRLTHAYFAFLTLAFAMILYTIASTWYGLTGGDNGVVGLSVGKLLSSTNTFYFFVLAITGACIVLIKVIVDSPFGLMLRAIRENPQRLRFIGINVRRYQLITFVIAGLFAGVAGTLFALLDRSVFPTTLYWTRSGELLLMILLGGMYHFAGPAVGAALLVYLDKFISDYTEYWPFFLGMSFLAIVLFLRGGLLGFAQERLDAFRAKRTGAVKHK